MSLRTWCPPLEKLTVGGYIAHHLGRAASKSGPKGEVATPSDSARIGIAFGIARGRTVKLSHRRRFLHLTVGAAALPAISRIARADTYPSRPVRIIAGFPAGTSTDITARVVGQWLSERLGQQFVVENRPGAGTNIATEMVAHAPSDGYTILWITQTNAINATLYDKLNFNFIRDIQPVASVVRVPAVLVVNPSFPSKTVPEFVAYAKSNPGKINYASPGIGSLPHVAGELFKFMTGVNMIHIAYRDSYVPDLLSGQVQTGFPTLPFVLEHIKTGKLRALAVTTAVRQEVLPDVPTVAEFVPGYEAVAWFGIGVPKKTPAEIVDKLSREVNVGVADSKIKERLENLGEAPMAMSPGDFSKLVADETEKWGKVIRAANIKADQAGV